MAGHHVGLELVAKALGEKHAVQEDGGLCHLGLLEVFLSAFEHEVCDTETQNLVCFLKELLGFGIVVVEVFAHSYKLGTLTGENICFHIILFLIRRKINKLFPITEIIL